MRSLHSGPPADNLLGLDESDFNGHLSNSSYAKVRCVQSSRDVF